MNITAQKLTEITNGKLLGNKDFKIESIKSLTSADEKSLSYLADAAKLNLLQNTKAGLLILPAKLEGEKLPCTENIIFCKDPQAAFITALNYFQDIANPKKKAKIHSTAIIDNDAKLGSDIFIGANCIVCKNAVVGGGTTIEANSFIGENVKIGRNCHIYPTVTVREKCRIGNNCIIHSGAVIGSDGFGYTKCEDIYIKIPQIGTVIIGDNVEIGVNTTIDRAALDETVIGEGTKIDNLVQIAHNVKIGRNCIIVSQVGIAGSAVIGDNVILSGQVGISDHIEIGKNAIVTAQSGVMSKVEENEIVFGSPARPHKTAMKIQAILSKLPDMYKFFRKATKGLGKKGE
ncbi:MAG TPA: UDP-3-O-(3-hydroxymyristoyl)glucosamine N-acyltransferase [Elusimicrobiales bacterium]|nr:UDP-3-O-(3-hydroxymyristoyl)glucosamine N-acyltransferase [Elusimicrobiales bacterium]